MTSTAAWSRQVVTLLGHPAIKRVRRAVRDAGAWLDSLHIKNPAVAGPVQSVLFVCLGNICRSPFADRLARKRFHDAGIQCASAGIVAKQSNRCPDDARAVAAEYGVSLSDHQPTLLTPELIEGFDLIVVMEADQVRQLRRRYPQATRRIVLLSLFDPEARGSDRFRIEDPFLRPRSEFLACFRRIDRALQALAPHLVSPTGGPDSTGRSS